MIAFDFYVVTIEAEVGTRPVRDAFGGEFEFEDGGGAGAKVMSRLLLRSKSALRVVVFWSAIGFGVAAGWIV